VSEKGAGILNPIKQDRLGIGNINRSHVRSLTNVIEPQNDWIATDGNGRECFQGIDTLWNSSLEIISIEVQVTHTSRFVVLGIPTRDSKPFTDVGIRHPIFLVFPIASIGCCIERR
jgi:hypothetical protein